MHDSKFMRERENLYHESGVWYRAAELPKHDWSISVFITPGLSATIAIPGGNSFAAALVKPSTAHFEAQYGATCRIL